MESCSKRVTEGFRLDTRSIPVHVNDRPGFISSLFLSYTEKIKMWKGIKNKGNRLGVQNDKK